MSFQLNKMLCQANSPVRQHAKFNSLKKQIKNKQTKALIKIQI